MIDTHTAVAADVCCKYRKANRCDQDTEKNEEQSEKYLVASTASPYKFVKSVLTAIDEKYGEAEELKLLEELEKVSGCLLYTSHISHCKASRCHSDNQ